MAWKKKHFFRFYLIKILPKGRATPQIANEVWTYKKTKKKKEKKGFSSIFLLPLSSVPFYPFIPAVWLLVCQLWEFQADINSSFRVMCTWNGRYGKNDLKTAFPPLKNKSCQSCYKWPQALIYLAESCNRRFATILQNFLQNPLEWQ